MKSRIFFFLLGAVIFSSVAIYASTIAANDISYGNKTVKEAIDELYSVLQVIKLCEYKNSTFCDAPNHYSVGTMYECNPGDGAKRNFYILTVNNDNSVDMIMDRNISSSPMSWIDAMDYI